MQVDNGNSPEVAGAKVEVNNKTFPEIDSAYNSPKNWAAELVLTREARCDMQGARIGTVKTCLPP